MERPLSYTLFTPAVVTSPKACRDFVRHTLETLGLGELADAAAPCTSELVTNVHQHVRGEVHLRVTVESAGVRVAVYDESPVRPCPRGRVGGDAEDGRGKGVRFRLPAGGGPASPGGREPAPSA